MNENKQLFHIEANKRYYTDIGLIAHILKYDESCHKFYGIIENLSLPMRWYKSGIQVDNLRDFDCIEEVK